MTARVFISYSHSDKRFATRLQADLERQGFTVWRDERELRVGESVAEAIRAAIDASDYVMLVISPGSTGSPWVRREADVALNAELKGKIRAVLPLLRDGAEVPSLLEGKLYADFRPGRYGSGLKRVLERLAADAEPIVMAGTIVYHAEDLRGQLQTVGFATASAWRPTRVWAEITGGYLSYLRGDSQSKNAVPSVFVPLSPLPLEDSSPVLHGRGTQVATATLRLSMFHEAASKPEFMLKSGRTVLYVIGAARAVQQVVQEIAAWPKLGAGPREDLKTALEWWRSPRYPATEPVLVEAGPPIAGGDPTREDFGK